MSSVPVRAAVMLAQSVRSLPTAGGWAFEPKMDDFRAVRTVSPAGRVSLISRHHKPLGPYFPEVIAAAGRLPGGLQFDGGPVMPRSGGVDFSALRERNHAPAKRTHKLAEDSPAAFVAFDVLTLDGNDMRDQQYHVPGVRG